MLILESERDLEIVLSYCILNTNKTYWNASKQWIFMAPFNNRAMRGDSWKQKSLMEQRRHQSCKDKTVCSPQSQGTCVQLTRPYRMYVIEWTEEPPASKGVPSTQIMNSQLAGTGKNLPTSNACRSLLKWYRKKLQGNFSDGNIIKMYNSSQENIIRQRNG